MMKKLTVVLILLELITYASCKKDPDTVIKPKPDTPYQSILDVKWHRFFSSDTAAAYFLDPLLYNNYVVFCTRTIVGKKGKIGFIVLNKQSGQRHPAWNKDPDGIISDVDIFDFMLCGKNQNIACVTNRKSLFGFNLENGVKVWQHDYYPYAAIYKFTTLYDKPIHSFGPAQKKWFKLAVFNPKTGSKRVILTLNMIDNYESSILPPSSWISPNNDTILFFLTSGVNFNILDGRVDAYAYNLSADTFLWKVSDIDNNGNASFYSPIIVQNKVIFQCNSSIHCFDILSGQMLWEHEFTDQSFTSVPNLYAEGKVFARSHSDQLLAFDVNSGQILWKTGAYYGLNTGGSMGYYKGKLYFTGIDMRNSNVPNLLFCLSASTGELLWKDCAPEESGLKDGIVIDQSTGYLYATDSYRIMCIDLNNTPKP